MSEQSLTKRTEDGLTPGFGVAGQVFCPFSFMAPKMCMKQGCELWVELTYGQGTDNEYKVGRCSLAWIAILAPELRSTIEKVIPKPEG